METVRDYYMYRDGLLKSIKNETNQERLDELKNELLSVENWISLMEEIETNDRNTENELRKSNKKH